MRKLIVFFIFLSIFLCYWLKCQSGINIFDSFSLSGIAPFSALKKHQPVVYASEFTVGMTLVLDKPSDWQKIWMRQADAVGVEFKDRGTVAIHSKSKQDWSLAHQLLVAVKPGERFGFSVDIENLSDGLTSSASVILYDKDKQIIRWHWGLKSVTKKEKKPVTNEFIVPYGVSFIRFRLTGSGIGVSEFSNIRFYRKEGIGLEEKPIVLENPFLTFNLEPQMSKITVLDKRGAKQWQAPTNFGIKAVTQKSVSEVKFSLLDWQNLEEYEAEVKVVKDNPEIIFKLNAPKDKEFNSIIFPPVFSASQDAIIVAPIAEGLLLDRKTWNEVCRFPLRYKGGWSMPFIGTLEQDAGWMQIIETPVDFELIPLKDKEQLFENRWIAEKNKFGYARLMRYVFFDAPSYVAMAKRYREWAKENGLLVTLEQKNAQRHTNITKLFGAVNIWYWGKVPTQLIAQLKKHGVTKAIFSTCEDTNTIGVANKAGFLSSHYDIYQDVWPPIYHEVTSRHEGWPDDLVLDEKGQWIKGWVIKRGLKEYEGGVICSIPGLERARKNIAEELKKKPYTARFIDTTTSSPWRECFSLQHPTTRREDLENKMKLLAVSSLEHRLVTGSEDGVASAVPYCDYFEGMMSIGIGRLPDSGRNVAKVEYMPATENFLKYQVGVDYRIPLWELVFHECAVATWYWGDSSNRIPELWWRKDLFNILYGNMPLWAIRDWQHWEKLSTRFVECFNNVSPVFEKVAAKQMLSHRFVTSDHTVQETTFEGGVQVIVNFGESSYQLNDLSYTLPAHGFVVFEDGRVWKEGICF